MEKNPPANAGDVRELGLIPKSGISHREGNGNPLQCSRLLNSMDRGACQATVHEAAESDMTEQLSLKHLLKVYVDNLNESEKE